jgi:hypothetical protein
MSGNLGFMSWMLWYDGWGVGVVVFKQVSWAGIYTFRDNLYCNFVTDLSSVTARHEDV